MSTGVGQRRRPKMALQDPGNACKVVCALFIKQSSEQALICKLCWRQRVPDMALFSHYLAAVQHYM